MKSPGLHPSSGAAAERFAAFAHGLDLDAIDGGVREAVALHLLDVLGCGLAAVGTNAAPFASAYAAGEQGGSATGLGVASPLPAATAALVNGIACHALDFDDTHPRSIAHVSAVVAPAALAAAQRERVTGRQLATALLAGNEITCRVGRVAGDAFHLRGFHPTAICGVFGATAAVALLTGLDERRMAHALGIAGSMAGGLMAYLGDGSETKRIHPGWMAHAAHVAVRLAQHGATGPAGVLEGRFGVFGAFLDMHHVGADELAADLGSTWETREIAFKPYPACHFVHAPLDALDQLRAKPGFHPDAVDRVTVFLPAAGMELVGEPIERKRRPGTPYESKFSAPFVIGASLRAGMVDATTFAEPVLSDPGVLAFADRVDCELHEYDTYPTSLPGGVRVRLRDGTEIERHLRQQRGGASNPMTSAEVQAKFRGNAGSALAGRDVAALERAVLDLADLADLGAFAGLGAAEPRNTP